VAAKATCESFNNRYLGVVPDDNHGHSPSLVVGIGSCLCVWRLPRKMKRKSTRRASLDFGLPEWVGDLMAAPEAKHRPRHLMTPRNVAQRIAREVQAPMAPTAVMKAASADGLQILFVIALIPSHQLQAIG
jgi:hypothetical protein